MFRPAMPAYLLRHQFLGLLVLGMLVVSLFSPVTSASAESLTLTATDIHRQVEDGEMILLDIRTPQEWQQTGLAAGAWPVSMHEEDFGQRLQDLLMAYRPTQIALICATGGRSTRVIEFLEKNGVSGVTNISEGMFGNGRYPGWVARELPMTTLEAARRSYEMFTRRDQQ